MLDVRQGEVGYHEITTQRLMQAQTHQGSDSVFDSLILSRLRWSQRVTLPARHRGLTSQGSDSVFDSLI
jgi:hypothetical protein